MKDDTRQRNNTGFPNGTGAPYYMEMSTFSALVKNFEKKKNPKCKVSCAKNFIPVHMKAFGHNKRFVNCKPPGYAFESLPETLLGTSSLCMFSSILNFKSSNQGIELQAKASF